MCEAQQSLSLVCINIWVELCRTVLFELLWFWMAAVYLMQYRVFMQAGHEQAVRDYAKYEHAKREQVRRDYAKHE